MTIFADVDYTDLEVDDGWGFPPLPPGEVRKLRTNWTIEAQQDLAAMHSIDIAQELTNRAIQDINNENGPNRRYL